MKLSPDKKLAGVLCPVFSIRTESDLGIGDTEGVRQMIDWCHRHGFGVLQVLPINETSGDSSPYNAVSSLAIEPTTVAISPELIPDLSKADFDRLVTPELLNELRSGPVRYGKVKPLKRSLLRAAFDAFLIENWEKGTPRKIAFDAFVAANGDWIADYAIFRVLMEEHNNWPTWDKWPEVEQDPQTATSWLLSLPEDRREQLMQKLVFFQYVQWIAFEQWTKLKEYAQKKKVFLVGDIPFGVSPYSADVWANRDIFDLNWSGGAPPEGTFGDSEFTRHWGQNWGIPLYRWDVLRERNFDWWRMRIENVHKIFHAFRVDHALGFYRIYAFPWPPSRNAEFAKLTETEALEKTEGLLPRFFPGPDETEEEQAANLAQGDELLRMVKDAATDTVVIAEDLGTVPPYVRPHLLQLEIPGFKVPHWERTPDYEYMDGADYPRLSVCTPSTHDHDPLAGMWRRMWREHEEALLQNDKEKVHATWLELQRFCKWCGLDPENIPRDFSRTVHEAYCRRVLESNSWLAVFQLADVFGQETRLNVPGSVGTANWSARLDKTVSELDHDPQTLHKVQSFTKLVKESNRKH
ncbi:MAG TPA: 4-alpha-glucanotransferase [Verrucomicrobiae bacterium]|nr:4-alpha-glucanotransferase [Verrucomicrobiae bacterium]